MYEVPAIGSGDSVRRVAQHLHTPYETVRQTVNRLEDAGCVRYDDGLSVVNSRVRDGARELVKFLEQRGFEETDSHAKEWFYDTEVIEDEERLTP